MLCIGIELAAGRCSWDIRLTAFTKSLTLTLLDEDICDRHTNLHHQPSPVSGEGAGRYECGTGAYNLVLV